MCTQCYCSQMQEVFTLHLIWVFLTVHSMMVYNRDVPNIRFIFVHMNIWICTKIWIFSNMNIWQLYTSCIYKNLNRKLHHTCCFCCKTVTSYSCYSRNVFKFLLLVNRCYAFSDYQVTSGSSVLVLRHWKKPNIKKIIESLGYCVSLFPWFYV